MITSHLNTLIHCSLYTIIFRESDSELDSLYDALKKHDDIRFATYRTAAKLRYIQRKTFLQHVDIWNMIEAFRENGLNSLEPGTLVNRARVETLLASLYSRYKIILCFW